MTANKLNYNLEYFDIKPKHLLIIKEEKNIFIPLAAEELIIRCLCRMVAVVVAATRMFGVVDAIRRGIRLH